VPVSVERGRVGRETRLQQGLAEARGIGGIDERVGSDANRVDPLGARPQRHARNAEPVGLLLQASGVGRDARGSRDESEHLEVAERGKLQDVLPEGDVVLVEDARRPGVHREHERPAARLDCRGDTPQLLRLRVRCTVEGQRDVRLRPRGRVSPRRRQKQVEHVTHHVAHHLDPSRDALGEQRLAGVLVRTEEERGFGVDGDPVVLLRHRQVPAAQAGLDVCDWNAGVPSSLRARERRVRVAEDEDPVGPLFGNRRGYGGAHRLGVGGVEVEAVPRRRQLELLVEHVRELRIPMLARVEADLLDTGVAQSGAHGTGLDELRAVAHDRKDLHGRDVTMAAASGR
jgi:hypothetical protein